MLALVAVVAVLLLSLTGLSVWLVQQAALDRARIALVGQARTLAAAVDHEFLLSVAMLRTLAGSESLASGQMDRFAREMLRAAGTFHDSAVDLIGPDAAPLSIMARNPGQGAMRGTENLASGGALAQPTISNLAYASPLGGAAISVALPIIPPGETAPTRLLATSLRRERMTQLVEPHRLADGVTGVIFDRELRFVARTGADVDLVGQLAPAALRSLALRGTDGAVPGLGNNIRGTPVVLAFARAALSGYIVAASVPVEAFAEPFRMALWPVLPIGAAITGTGLIAALLIGRRLRIAIGALTALAQGDATAESGFREVDEVAATLRREAAQRHRAEERQAVLMAELNHRVKNMLASVQSVADQTLRNAGSNPQRFAETFRGRLLSLARAHDLLTNVGWTEAALDDVLHAALSPWQGSETLIRLEGVGGTVVSPRQAQALVLALHELATNAAKYGALSSPGGFVRLRRGPFEAGRCQDARFGDARFGDTRTEILWQEVGGPPIAGPPERSGFGTRLLTRGLLSDLGPGPGTAITLDYEPDGLVARIVFKPILQAAPVLPQPARRAGAPMLSSTQS